MSGRHITVTFLMGTSLFITCSAASAGDTPEQILNRAIEQRYAWTSAELTIQLHRNGIPNSCWRLAFDESRSKGTVTADTCGSAVAETAANTLCHNCLTTDSVIRFAAGEDAIAVYDTAILPPNVAWIPDPDCPALLLPAHLWHTRFTRTLTTVTRQKQN